jgi:hypothetical protein
MTWSSIEEYGLQVFFSRLLPLSRPFDDLHLINAESSRQIRRTDCRWPVELRICINPAGASKRFTQRVAFATKRSFAG